MKQILLLGTVLMFYFTLFAGSFAFWQDKFQAALIPPIQNKEEQEKGIVLLFAGDIMLDRGVEWHIRQQGENWNWPFLKIADTLKEADLVFANLESVISDKGTRQGSIYSFRADPNTMEGLIFAGIDAVSVANNHSLDYGTEALLDSIQRLKDAGIIPVGGGTTKVEAHAPAVLAAKDMRISFLAYTQTGSPLWQAGEQSPGIAWMDSSRLSQLKEDIRAAREISDIVVISFHFGDEYQKEPNGVQRLLSTSAINYGADLVVGHHPHVVQPIEQYKQGWIAWSLGNFVFDQGFSKETMEGFLLKVVIKEKSITEVMPIPIQLSPQFQPAISKESI